MVSSKFSRPVPVQQPPPVCKKSVPVMGAKFPLHEQSMSVAFNTKLWFPREPAIRKEDGGMLAMGKNIGSPTQMHWQTSPFNDPKPNAWRADLKINTSTGFARSVFWWVITQATVWQFVGNGYPDLEQKMWEWKPTLTPAFGIAGSGQILFATVNK